MLANTLLHAVLAIDPPSSEVLALNKEPAPPAPLTPLREVAVGAFYGMSRHGIAVRKAWRGRFGAQLSLFSTFGLRYGVHSVGAAFSLIALQRRLIRLYLTAPVQWRYDRKPTERAANFGPDSTVFRRHRLRAGAGPGIELFFGPVVSVSLECPVVFNHYWSSGEKVPSDGYEGSVIPAPNVGIYVYFK